MAPDAIRGTLNVLQCNLIDLASSAFAASFGASKIGFDFWFPSLRTGFVAYPSLAYSPVLIFYLEALLFLSLFNMLLLAFLAVNDYCQL